MSVTLLYAVYNRAMQFHRTLRRLAQIGTMPDEIIVVDDGSNESVEQIVRQVEREQHLPIQYVYRNWPLYDACSVPRNIGLKMAHGDWIITAEPEVAFIEDAIAIFQDTVREHPAHIAVQGLLYMVNIATPIDDRVITDPEALLKEWDIRQFPHHSVENYPPNTVCWDNPVSPYAAIYKREWLLDMGGWDEDFARAPKGKGVGYGHDDIDLLTRLRIKGHNQVWEERVRVIHQWHDRDGANLDGVVLNEAVIRAKNLNVNGYEDPHHPDLVANRGREWGVIECGHREHNVYFCRLHLHCKVCQPREDCR